MTQEDFAAFVRRMRATYERRPPDKDVELFWFSEAGARIPSEARDWIFEHVKSGWSEKFPAHFQDVLKTAYGRWLDAHPEKRAREPEARACGARECINGRYYVRRTEENGVSYPAMAPCTCGRARAGKNMRRWTWAELVAAGYVLDTDELAVRVTLGRNGGNGAR